MSEDDGADSLQALFQGTDGSQRLVGVRWALQRALDAWWSRGQLPSLALLRDGLLALEAGHDLDEAERTLLLRTALYYDRGTVTTLRHQRDPERVASVLADMLLDARRPLPSAQVQRLLQADDDGVAWTEALQERLREEVAIGLEPRSILATAALLHLQGEESGSHTDWLTLAASTAAALARRDLLPDRQRSVRAARHGLWALTAFLAVVAALIWWQTRRAIMPLMPRQVTIPAGTYLIADTDRPGQTRPVQLTAFALDRTEVTNRAYRRCVQQGACPAPAGNSSATRSGYFLDPAFDHYPVVRVSWADAVAYCTWSGQQLPQEEEWEVAASAAVTLRHRFTFPWGDTFDPGRVNSAARGIGDTQPVGQYSPAGDSPFGAADMAGNAAEWTATPGDTPNSSVIKGGSFRDGAARLRTGARLSLLQSSRKAWLGFRCVRSLPGE